MNIARDEIYETYRLVHEEIEKLNKLGLMSVSKLEELLEPVCQWESFDKIRIDYDKTARYTTDDVVKIFEDAERLFSSCAELNIIDSIVEKCDVCIGLICYLAEHRELWNDTCNVLLLKRIFLNSLLIKFCLAPLLKLTEDRLCLTTKMEYELNICVIISQTDYFKNIFDRRVRELSRHFNGMDGCDVRVYYLLGLLNFMRNSYKESMYFLRKAYECYSKRKDAVYDAHYFQTRILIAYCYEYMHEFDKAINELMGCCSDDFLQDSEGISTIYNLFDHAEYECGVKATREFYKKHEEKVFENDLLHKSLFHDAILRDRKNGLNDECGDKHEVLHSFAHCCNELAIKCKRDDVAKSEQLFTVARNTMLYVANANEADLKECADFSTCLFMIFAEANDFEVCEKQIDNIMRSDEISGTNDFYKRSIGAAREKYSEQGDFWAEVNFYKYLVSYFSFKSISEKKIGVKHSKEDYKKAVEESYKGYLNYASNRYDYDAEAYIKIFEYKFKLAQGLRKAKDLQSLRSMISEAVDSVSDLKRPSPFVNEWIQYEYEKIVLVGEFLSRFVGGAPLEELFALSSRCSRMYSYRGKEEFFDLQEGEPDMGNNFEEISQIGYRFRQQNTNTEFTISYSDDMLGDSVIECETQTEAKKLCQVLYVLDIVMDDFVSPRSIFILAPLSAAAPYQYQTGNPSELVKSIFTSDNNSYFRGTESEIVEKFRSAGDYDEHIVEKMRSVRTNLKMIAFGNKQGEYYYYIDNHWDAPIKRPVFNVDGIGKLLNGIYRKAESDESYIKKSLDKKRHLEKCAESRGCSVLLYKYKQGDLIGGEINKILNMLFISSQELNTGDYILLKNGKKDWYVAVTKAEEDAQKIWDIISPPLCGVMPTVIKKSPIYTESDEDFISICYTSRVKDVVQQDAQYLYEHGFRIWFDEQINGVEKWTKQVERRILEPKCHKVIIYISRDLYQYRIPALKDDGLYHEIEFIYRHNEEHPDNRIEYFVVLVGAQGNDDISNFKADVLKRLWEPENRERSDILSAALFGEGHVHAVRAFDPANIMHFTDSDNKYFITLFSESKKWIACCKKGK